MRRWIPATPGAEAIEAVAQAMLRTGCVPEGVKDEFHTWVLAEAVIRELITLGYAITPTIKKDS